MSEITALSKGKSTNFIENNREQYQQYSRGDILNASLLYRSDGKAYLKAENGFEFSVDSKKVNGEAGDVLKFQVKKWGKNGIELKQLENDFDTSIKNLTRRISTKNLAGLMKSHNMLVDGKSMDGKESYTEEQMKTAQKVARVKAALARSATNSGTGVVAELIQSGLSLSKISTSVLNSIVTESEQRQPIIMSASELTEALKRSGAEGEQSQMVIQALYGQNLQSDGNFDSQSISSLNRFIDRLHKLPVPDDSSITRLLLEDKEITFENIYSAIHTGTGSYGTAGKQSADNVLSEDDVSCLSDEIVRTMAKEGISESDRALAEKLIKSGIPLNKVNIVKTKYLQKLDEILKDKSNLESILDNAAKGLKEGKPLNSVDLLTQNEMGTAIDKGAEIDRLNSIIQSLPEYTPTDIVEASNNVKELTLQSIDDAYKERTSTEAITTEAKAQEFANTTNLSLLTARRQMEEIRLKLTVQAANSLVGKNLPISVMPLKDVVDALRKAEQGMYSKSLRIVGGAQADTQENIEKMSELFGKLHDTNPMTYNTFADVVHRKVPFTIDGVHDSVMTVKNALKSYDSHATLTTSRYGGDSFDSTKNQFEPLLQDMNIDLSKENIRAAEILSKNGMDVNPSSISEIRAIDAKITAVQSRLHPSIGVKMITEGLNPTQMHIDEVLEYIDKFNDQYGENSSQKIAECLLDMNTDEYKGNIEAVIAIYRLLNLVQKDGGVAIGINQKAQREVTLGNLLNSAKYYARTKGKQSFGDYNIDDDFGALEGLLIPENNIRKQLDDAYVQAIKNKSEALLNSNGIQDYKDYDDKFNELNLGKTSKNLELIDRLTDEGFDTAAAKQIASNISVVEETLKEIASYATPEGFEYAGKKISESNPEADLNSIELREMLELLKEHRRDGEASSGTNSSLAEQLRNLNNISEDAVRDAAANGIPMTIGNLQALQTLRDNPDYLRAQLDSIVDGESDENGLHDTEEAFMTDEPSLSEELSIVEEIPIPDTDLKELKEGVSPEQILDSIGESLDSRPLVREIRLIQSAIKVQNFISRNDDKKPLALPVRLKNGIAMLNMYVVNPKTADEKTNVYMTVKTSSGSINARFTLNGDEPVYLSADGVEIDDTELWRSLPSMSQAGIYDIASGILKYIDERM